MRETASPLFWGHHDKVVWGGEVARAAVGWYGAYAVGEVTDPTGPVSGWYRVARGGSWHGGGWRCRSAYRYAYGPDYRLSSLGFRLVLAPHQGM